MGFTPFPENSRRLLYWRLVILPVETCRSERD